VGVVRVGSRRQAGRRREHGVPVVRTVETQRSFRHRRPECRRLGEPHHRDRAADPTAALQLRRVVRLFRRPSH